MTPPVDDPEALRQILANTEALLLDFDGPICSVFAGIPAHVVADQLRDVLAEGGHTDLPDDVRTAADPFEVLFYAAKLGQDEARYVEAAFRAHEVEAVQTAEPTPGAVELINEWKRTRRPLAIVSNNSRSAVAAYIDLYDIRRRVDHVAARADSDIRLLKPSPYLVTEAVSALGVRAAGCTLVGDSTTDIEAGRAAQVRTVAYANKASKLESLIESAPTAVTTTITGLLGRRATQETRRSRQVPDHR